MRSVEYLCLNRFSPSKVSMYLTDTLIFLLLVLIAIIEFRYEKRSLSVVLLYDNDHTLDKVLQNIIHFFEQFEIHFHITALKVKNPEKRPHSTGYLWNLGYRHSPKMENYFFIDSTLCPLSKYYELNRKSLSLDDVNAENRLYLLDSICAVSLNRRYFKAMDGFSNAPTRTYAEFLKTIEANRTSKTEWGGYMSTYGNVQYDIDEKVPLNSAVTRFVIVQK